ncbi:hypothetical protein GCM10007971_21410 [Oceanobacillus indicireducens]|uniref:ABC transporter domain-containing protein n=1 Tax=Oceanobacillus indicireducens TaxID=1004261 RepID=A0A917XZA8_9BACI|nr:hypothetical protein GCM10007971_21410 [Oceanobacillus indicireducens]
MTAPIVQYRDVCKSFGDVEVLKGINLDINPAEKVAVIGPSGSGKTTIIRLLMTLEEPTSGDIIVSGENLWKMEKNGDMVRANEHHLRKVRGDIGMVFQHFNLFPHMTILENCMTAPIHVKKENKEEVRKRAIEMLEKKASSLVVKSSVSRWQGLLSCVRRSCSLTRSLQPLTPSLSARCWK